MTLKENLKDLFQTNELPFEISYEGSLKYLKIIIYEVAKELGLSVTVTIKPTTVFVKTRERKEIAASVLHTAPKDAITLQQEEDDIDLAEIVGE